VDKPHPHWRQKCINCKRYRHPISEEWVDQNAVELYRSLLQKKHKSKVKD
jgi:Leu/Phe-tRNA-protein transferase